MAELPTVLLTNDDGIEARGIRAIADALSGVADVTVVAPAGDRSGASRADSREFDVREQEEGYAVEGTPADCVQFGVGWLDTEFDVVVSGCNDGPNLGAHRLSRSGTVAGAIEAAFLGVPGVALSLFDPPQGVREFFPEDYEKARRVARFLVAELAAAEQAFGYLNVNVPATAENPRLRITEPVREYDLEVSRAGEGDYRVRDRFWEPLIPDAERPVTDPVGTDRRAVADEEISVTPLCAGQRSVGAAGIEELADRFERYRSGGR